MRRIRTLVALSAVALISGAGHVSAAHIDTSASARARTADSPAAGSVTGVSVVPGSGRADVVVAVSGAGVVQDFILSGPNRIVVDISKTRLQMLGNQYDGVSRAGIINVRLAQYRPDVVRLVLEMESPRQYTVHRGEREVRVSLVTSASFAAWYSAGAPKPTTAAATPVNDAARPSAPPAEATKVTAAAAPTPTPVEAEPIAAAAQSAANAAANRSTTAPPRPTRMFQQSQQPRITVTYQDADIRDVLAAFAAFSGRTIVVGKEVTGTITAEIKDQPWDVALQAILQAQGLAATEESTGIITVDSYANILAKQASEPLTTQLVSINYANAGSLVETVRSLLSKDCPQGTATVATNTGSAGAQQQAGTIPAGSGCLIRGGVSADTATNTLLITEVTSRLPDLLGYVKELDVRTPQVALKAKIISVNRTQTEQLGVSYDLGSADTYFNTLAPRIPEGSQSAPPFEARIGLGGEAVAGVANANRKFKNGAALNLIFSTALGKYSLTSFLDALRENNLSDIQAEPSIVTLDNREARILVGQETPIRVIDAGSASQVGVPARANVTFKESGIILKVTPHITSNRQIRMTVSAEQSELRPVGGDLGFFFDKRNANTNLLVNDGETAVIGGLTQTQLIKNRSGIPFLVDLPLVGRLFGQTETREEKRDLLILITPHIIDEGEAVRPPGDR